MSLMATILGIDLDIAHHAARRKFKPKTSDNNHGQSVNDGDNNNNNDDGDDEVIKFQVSKPQPL